MTLIERLGQAGAFVLPFFYRVEIRGLGSLIALAVMGLALALYYAGWIRYLLRGRTHALLFAPLCGIPLVLAVAPVVYFGAAALLLHSWSLAVAPALLAVGHLGVSAWERRRV